MKRYLLLAAVMLAAISFLPAETKELKIGYVDVLHVFNEYNKTKEYDDRLEEKKTEVESKLEKKRDEIERLQKSLALLKEDKRRQEEEKLHAQVQEFRELERKTLIDLRRERDEKMREIFEDVTKIIDDYAKKNGFDLIIDKTAVHYGDKSMELTQEILDISNQQYRRR